MFQQEPKKNWVEAMPDQVAYLATSVNRPIVVPPGRSPEPAQAYVCILRSPKGYEFYIFLHLITSNLGLLYKWDAGVMPKETVPQVQQAATEFTESMGFMMNDLRWREMAPDQKEQLYNSMPAFFQDLSRFQEQVEEEVLEIEPVADELVVESVEEQESSVTEGDFVIQAEAFAEQKPEGTILDEVMVPPLEQSLSASPEPGQAPAEEDILLENLELKEDLEMPPPRGKARDTGLIIEMEESEAKPEPPLAAEPKVEVAWEQELNEAQPTISVEPEISAGIETEIGPGSETAPQPVMEVEEIAFETLAEPEPPAVEAKFAPVPEAKPAKPIPAAPAKPKQVEAEAASGISAGREEIFAEAANPVGPEAADQGDQPAAEGGLDPEDLKIMVKFLAMF